MQDTTAEGWHLRGKNKLGQLLDLVEQGEETMITRHGKEVADEGRQ
jgi:hypothetical protein